MKVLLIQPPPGANSFVAKSGVPEPLALEILAATINHHDVKIFDMRLDKQTLRNQLEDFQPDVVGVGCLTAGYYECINLLEAVKQVDPNIITVVGGHHPTVMPQDFIDAFTDYIVIGEGEATFHELVDTLELKRDITEVKGIAVLKKESIHYTGERPLIDLDKIPIPRRELTSQYRKRYFRGATKSYACLLTSRGCQFRCKFCCQWVLNRGAFRIRKTENVVEELLQIQENFIDFADDNSWANANWMGELCDKIQQAGIQKQYKLYARSDLIIQRPDLIGKWKELGLKAVLIGYESFRDDDLKKWHKRNTVANNIKATKVLKEFGVEIVGYFLVDPAFSEKDFQQLSEHVQKLEIDQPIFSILTPFPGTQLFDEVKDKILTRNYTYYDGMHALVPTELDPKKFYKLYADLFRKSYPKTKLIKKIVKGEISFSLSQALTQTRYLRQLTDVSAL
jgi:radical SAM superfamily enzyme YgiQ (UPF0313 family)